MKKIFCPAIILLIMCMSLVGVYAQEKEDFGISDSSLHSSSVNKTISVGVPAGGKAVKASDTALKLNWKKVADASGYSVYKWNAKSKKYTIEKTLTGKSKITWTDKNLKSNVTYKYKVRAFITIAGKRQYGSYSETISARAFTDNAKTINVKSIQVDYDIRYLGLNGTKKVLASVVAAKGKKPLSKSVTWKSTNPSIVKVNKYGWIQAQGKSGKAKVVIRAHNGITRTLTISVADYAHPVNFSNLDKVKAWNKNAASILSKYRKEMSNIAAFLERYKKSTHYMYEDGDLHIEFNYINCDPVRADLTGLLKVTNRRVMLERGEVFFGISAESGGLFNAMIVYTDDNGKDDQTKGKIKIAPCWYFVDGRNDLD